MNIHIIQPVTARDLFPEMVKCVDEFHRTFSHPHPKAFEDAANSVAYQRHAFLRDEYQEYDAAGSDRAQRIDAIGDLLYFVAGNVVALGLKSTVDVRPFMRYHSMPEYREKHTWASFAGEMQSALNELNKSQLCKNGLIRTHNDLAQALIDTAHLMDADIRTAFNRIHAANMGKLWPSPLAPIPANWRFEPILNRGLAPYYIVYDETGKVRKPPAWVAPDLSDL